MYQLQSIVFYNPVLSSYDAAVCTNPAIGEWHYFKHEAVVALRSPPQLNEFTGRISMHDMQGRPIAGGDDRQPYFFSYANSRALDKWLGEDLFQRFCRFGTHSTTVYAAFVKLGDILLAIDRAHESDAVYLSQFLFGSRAPAHLNITNFRAGLSGVAPKASVAHTFRGGHRAESLATAESQKRRREDQAAASETYTLGSTAGAIISPVSGHSASQASASTRLNVPALRASSSSTEVGFRDASSQMDMRAIDSEHARKRARQDD